MNAQYELIVAAIQSGSASLPTVLLENWVCLTQDQKELIGVLTKRAGQVQSIAGALISANPLVLTMKGFTTNFANSAAFPLNAQVGPGAVTVGGKYTVSSALGVNGNNSSHVQIPDVIMPWGTAAVAYGYNQLGVSIVSTGAGSVTPFVGLAQWMVSDAVASAAASFVVDSRGHRHVTLGMLTGGNLVAATEATGGGISVSAQWPLPSNLAGGCRWALKTSGTVDDVVVLFPADMSDPKLCVVCHGAGEQAESMINSGTGLSTQSNYQMGSEPIIKALLSAGYVVVCSRGPTTTAWGNELSYQMAVTMVKELRRFFTFSKSVILSTSMGGLTGLRLLASDSAFTHWYGLDPVTNIVAMAGDTVSFATNPASLTNTRMTTFSSTILAAHGNIANIGLLNAATDPNQFATSVWAGKKMRASVVGGASTNLALGCDGTVARASNWDALKTRADAGGAVTSTDVGSNNGSAAGYDHGFMGNFIVSNITTHFAS